MYNLLLCILHREIILFPSSIRLEAFAILIGQTIEAVTDTSRPHAACIVHRAAKKRGKTGAIDHASVYGIDTVYHLLTQTGHRFI